MENKDRKTLLSVRDLEVKFHVRGRELTAIRGVSFDLYENESVAIVGESGSGKSVLTKTFAGMLDENGFISNGDIIFNDDELVDTNVRLNDSKRRSIQFICNRLNSFSGYASASGIFKEIQELKAGRKRKLQLTDEEEREISDKIARLDYSKTEEYNLKLTLNPRADKKRYQEATENIAAYKHQMQELENKKKSILKERKAGLKADSGYNLAYKSKLKELKKQYGEKVNGSRIGDETKSLNLIIAKEIYLSIGRYGFLSRIKFILKLLKVMKKACVFGVDLSDEEMRNKIFDEVVFRVKYVDETGDILHGICVLNLAKIKYSKDWSQIRGKKISTIFQDPMTSLNPIITIGKQVTSIILKHQNCTEIEARARAITLMKKVGIPNAENRFDDYPFQYSGGMRQRIVIAIALSCQPKILICDEPTTALDVTIQSQILDLLKELQKEFGYSIVFITHDLGVVANVADRVIVLYAGQIVEMGSAEDIFYDPRHPYTWALLMSLPQLAEKNAVLYSISGTPPSLYNKIVGDSFAPRNPYCMRIDTLQEPPMFKVSDTHYAKTWLLDPRAPEIKKPDAIQNIYEKLMKAFNLRQTVGQGDNPNV